MSITIKWPAARARRLRSDMAEDARRLEQIHRRTWDAERIAATLVPHRDELVSQLPRELASARGLTRDQHEFVIDEAIDYMVTEYAKPITDRHELDRAFWATASFRVKRMHEGRGATVRAGWQRVDVDDVEIPSYAEDPVAHAVRSVEQGALLEFTATLTQVERLVLTCKFADGPKQQGRVVVARRLGLPVPEVRRAERAITRKLERFVATLAAGTLCAHRGSAIEALALGSADEQQDIVARAHLRHCSACRTEYAAYLRAIRSGELQHRIAQLLPLPAAVAESRHRRAPWDAITDWLARPWTSEAASTGAQLSAGSRGIGAIAATKLATLCIGGAAAIGGATYCVTSVLQDVPPRPRAPTARHAPKPEPRLPTAAPTVAAVRKAAEQRAARRRKRTSGTAFSNRGHVQTRHERETPISPPTLVSGQQTAEFEPAPAGPVTRSAAAPSTGAPEFP